MAAAGVKEALSHIQQQLPDYAILDLKLEDGNGLEVVRNLQSLNPACRIIILTGFGNIATAVAAVKAGALTISRNQRSLMRLLGRCFRLKAACLRHRKIP